MLKTSMQSSDKEDALILAKAAKIVRKEIFASTGFTFNASFPQGCQQESVPTKLKSLVNLLLRGGDIIDQDSCESQSCLTIAQLLLFNCKKVNDTKQKASGNHRHSLNYEPPMPLYLGLSIHTQTRSKKLVMEMHELGLSIRVLQIENQIAFSVCEYFKKNNVVCPAQLHKGLFTVGALDNLDYNPSSTTAKDSFHGTGSSYF